MQKNRLRYLFPLATGLCMLWAADVKTDHDRHADFARYHTYSWTQVKAGNDLCAQRIQQDYNGFGGGWFWRGFGGGMATTEIVNQPVGTLVVDLFDGQSRHLVWRGSASQAISDHPEENEKKLEHSVEDMFKHFPPPSNG